MTLYFAYGSNMSLRGMKERCPSATPLGAATVEGYSFLVGIDGWGSIKRMPGRRVHGVLWRVTPRDLAALHAYELLDKGLYGVRYVPVRTECGLVRAVTYVLRRQTPGRPKPGYVEMIAACARGWKMPEPYVRSVERWSVSRWTGARQIDVGDNTA